MSDDNTVKIRWNCFLFFGAPKWHGTDIYEPDECGNEFDTVEDRAEWDEKTCTAVCPKCGGQLTQRDDHPELVEALAKWSPV